VEVKPSGVGLDLSWASVPAATDYQVHALARDGRVVEAVSTKGAPSWTLAGEDLDRLIAAGATGLRIVAWAGEREIARSPAIPFPDRKR
jgi:hypothetical protein